MSFWDGIGCQTSLSARRDVRICACDRGKRRGATCGVGKQSPAHVCASCVDIGLRIQSTRKPAEPTARVSVMSARWCACSADSPTLPLWCRVFVIALVWSGGGIVPKLSRMSPGVMFAGAIAEVATSASVMVASAISAAHRPSSRALVRRFRVAIRQAPPPKQLPQAAVARQHRRQVGSASGSRAWLASAGRAVQAGYARERSQQHFAHMVVVVTPE